MKPLSNKIVVLIFFVASCAAWKGNLKSHGDRNVTVENAIIDFLNTERLSKKDSVFSIIVEDLNNNILAVSILGDESELYPGPNTKIGKKHQYFPSRYKVQNNKLFYWYDSTHVLTEDFVSVLSKYNHIDSLNVNGIVEIRGFINDAKKGVGYYFCKNNLLKYKKHRGTIAMGYYDPPNLKCNTLN